VSPHVTTHVLDAVLGAPAVGLAVGLSARVGDGLRPIAAGVTDHDGRCSTLGPDRLEEGVYRLVFGTGPYFAERGTESFYPEITVDFLVRAGRSHYHVPILLSPFAYSTYRGS